MKIVCSTICLLFIIGTVSATITNKFWGNEFLSNSIDPKDQLQQIANGLWEQVNLTDPTTLLDCFDDNSAQDAITFLDQLNPDLANEQYLKIPALALNFINNLPPAVTQCLKSNQEVLQCEEAYGTANTTLADLLKKIQKYVVDNLSSIHDTFVTMNNEYQAGNYDAYGKDTGALLQAVMGSSEASLGIDPKDELQQIANGLWEQANLSDPTTLLDCFDENSAQLAINFLDELNPDLANEQYLKVPTLALNFVKNLPPSVMQCLKSNQEVLQCEEAYGTANITLSGLLDRIRKYVFDHLSDMQATFVSLNNEYQAGNYDGYGKDTGVLLQAVMSYNQTNSVHDPKDQLQQIANGFWEQANLADPTTVLDCFDDNATELTLNFFNELSPDLANQQYLKVPDLVLNFQKSLPPATSQCLNSNQEVLQCGEAYGTTNITLAQLLVKIQKYVVFHLNDMHSTFVNMNNDYQAANYDAYGKDLGVFLQTIMGGQMNVAIDPKDELQQIANGLWEQVNLTDPTTLLDCFDDNSAQDAITFLDQLNPDLANEQYLKIPALALNFINNLPPAVTQCLKSNQEVLQCEEAYGTANTTLADLLKKIQKYVVDNLSSIHDTFVTMNNEYQAGNYDAYGKDTGALLQAVMGSSEASLGIDPKDELQQIANGLWEQANLTDPTTVISCFDDKSAKATVEFLGNLNNDLANKEYLKVPTLVLAYKANLPSPVTKCLQGNPEASQCANVYGTANITLADLFKKIEAYAIDHTDQIHDDFVNMNTEFQGGQFTAYGKDTGSLLQAIMNYN